MHATHRYHADLKRNLQSAALQPGNLKRNRGRALERAPCQLVPLRNRLGTQARRYQPFDRLANELLRASTEDAHYPMARQANDPGAIQHHYGVPMRRLRTAYKDGLHGGAPPVSGGPVMIVGCGWYRDNTSGHMGPEGHRNAPDLSGCEMARGFGRYRDRDIYRVPTPSRDLTALVRKHYEKGFTQRAPHATFDIPPWRIGGRSAPV